MIDKILHEFDIRRDDLNIPVGSKKYIRSFSILWWLCVIGATVLVIGFVYSGYLILFSIKSLIY
jgi:hypothetical protein